ncbi:hypothetical protein Ami103574_05500 [Aminipila butyrica]|uniref:DUF1980 domain-containing protein n=1 Tax=Aminipila butyrica TaxID=433296 RepID=A0A858BUN9_9FIRM|nr:hypothetical protein [Aminipila butyrica]QIB68808.1 hypothetical protein Ami103574_05500 [Aminipila butyrica]
MKKFTSLLMVCALVALTGCQGGTAGTSGSQNDTGAASDTVAVKTKASAGDTVEIKEKMFLAQLNDIYLNQEDYLGKTIKYEGMFTQYTWEEKGVTYYMVYRQSPGCCGADGQAGFEVVWPEGASAFYPQENDWVEAVGVLETVEEDGYTYLRLSLSSLTVLPTRGAEFVNQ